MPTLSLSLSLRSNIILLEQNNQSFKAKTSNGFLGSPYADANQLLSAASASGGITMVPIASTAPLMTSLPMSSTMSEYCKND